MACEVCGEKHTTINNGPGGMVELCSVHHRRLMHYFNYGYPEAMRKLDISIKMWQRSQFPIPTTDGMLEDLEYLWSELNSAVNVCADLTMEWLQHEKKTSTR